MLGSIEGGDGLDLGEPDFEGASDAFLVKVGGVADDAVFAKGCSGGTEGVHSTLLTGALFENLTFVV